MLKKIFYFFLGLSIVAPTLLFFSVPTWAATSSVVIADAGPDKNVVINRPVLFSAADPANESYKNSQYVWNFGDGEEAIGTEVTHIYRTTGIFRVKLKVTTTINKVVYSAIDEAIVRVDKDLVVLISDKRLDPETFSAIKSIAKAKGSLLINIQEESDGLDYIIEKELSQKILLNAEDFRQAGEIVIWTDKSIGLNALIAAMQSDRWPSLNFAEKYLVIVTNQELSSHSASAQKFYNSLKPQFIVLTKEAAQTEVFSNNNIDSLLGQLREKNEEFRIVGMHTQRDASELKYYNFFSYFISYMVDRGVPLNTIYLVLVLPVIATVVAFSRQVIGFKAIGIYTPSIIAVAFLATGLRYGIIIFFLTLLVGTLGRLLARKLRIAYLPRMALVLTLVSLAIFVFFLVGVRLGNSDILTISIFPILIMVLLTEEFITLEIERGIKAAVILSLETLALTIACFLLASWPAFKTMLLGYPEIILLTIIINILIGRWTGLRLLEYYRFRKVIKNVELAEKK
jgi:PKD repeat protein